MFVSAFFLVFLGITAVLFYLLPGKWRPALLLGVSYVFCAWIDIWALPVLFFYSFFTWMIGRKIEASMEKGQKAAGKAYMVFTVAFYVFLLCLYKYLPSILARTGLTEQLPDTILKRLGMPVGLSFYLFQAIGYLVDVYKGRSRAEKSFLYLSCYLAFFPKFVSGPIEREQDFLPQLRTVKTVKWNRGRLSAAFTYMLWGYFMKMVLADRLALTVNLIFEEPSAFDSFWLILGAFFYTIQIYCDFAGYSYIAVGCAQIFGISLSPNFQTPYLASSITDFWRRWHISLSRWLRDYIYIPLGGNRRGVVRKCLNTMAVFLICGMWHGAGMNFVAWGLLHGIYSVLEIWGKQKGWKIWGGRLLTFLAVAFAWIFFRASGFRAAAAYIVRMFTAGIRPEGWGQTMEALQLSPVEIALIIIGMLAVGAADVLSDWKKASLPVMVQHRQNAVRYLFFYLLILAIFIFGMYGPGYHVEQFIYMQF